MPLSNVEKIRRYREKLRTEKLRSAQSIKAIVAVRRALYAPPPPEIRMASCGLPYYLDRKGIPLRYVTGYSYA